jgi:transcription antitermination factor NusG
MNCESLQNATPSPNPSLNEGSILLRRQNWYAVYTRTHHEKTVAHQLIDRGIENFLPLYKVIHNWTNNRKAALDLPLFPNYLFVFIASRERVRTLEVPGVVSLVGQGSTPAPLPEIEIQSLRSALAARKLEPHSYITAGAKARIVTGPLTGLEGVVLRTKSGGLRVILSVDMIRQSVAVEVSADELEPNGFYAPAC